MTYGRADQQYNTVRGGVDDVVAKVHDNIKKCYAATWELCCKCNVKSNSICGGNM